VPLWWALLLVKSNRYFYYICAPSIADDMDQLPLNLVLLKNISVVGIHWGAYSSE
jgi:hypothetical protein